MMLRKKHVFHKILFLFLVLFLPSFVIAQIMDIKDYTVERGDTLWEISDKELKDPFLWPKIWKENPVIKNPDLIYPRQKIKIPLYLLQKEIIPETKPLVKAPVKRTMPADKPVEQKIEPIKREYLVNKHILISSGYIAETLQSVGEITDTRQPGQTVVGKGDYAYIKVNRPVKKGDRFYVTVPLEEIKHPKTGVSLGYLVDVRGTVEVIGQEQYDEPLVLVTNSYYDIYTGNLLNDYYEIEPPIAPENPRKPDINGYVVESKHSRLIYIPYDVAYIDKGRKDGLEVGDLLATTIQGKHNIYNGLVQVINTRNSTSTVIIRKSNDAIARGDGVTGIKQESLSIFSDP